MCKKKPRKRAMKGKGLRFKIKDTVNDLDKNYGSKLVDSFWLTRDDDYEHERSPKE